MRRILRLIALVLAALIPGPPVLAQPAPPGQALSGPWAFHPGDDPAWSAPGLDDAAWERLAPDRPWGRQGHPRLGGVAWYRLRVPVPPEPPPEGLAVLVSGVQSTWELYVDGERVGGAGGLPPRPRLPMLRPPQALRIPPERLRGPSVLLALRVWYPPHQAAAFPEGGGLAAAPRLGPAPLMEAEALRRKAAQQEAYLADNRVSWALTVAFALMAAFHLHLWRRRRQVRENLTFGLLAAAMAVRELGNLVAELPFEDDQALVFRLGWGGLTVASALFIEFLWPLLGRPIPRWLRAYQALHGVFLLLLFMPMPVAHGLVHRWGGTYFELPVLVAFIGLLAGALRRGHPEARALGRGAAVLALACGYELVSWTGLWPNYNTASLGFAAFLLSMAAALADRFARVHTELESLTEDLEKKVAERTRELEAAQERIAHLNASAKDALHDLPGWASSMAHDLARAVGAHSLEVWGLDGAEARPLTDSRAEPPDFSGLDTLTLDPARLEAREELVVPVSGPTGELRAALVVRGKAQAWTQEERRLLESFATHLGGALDLQRLRLEVARSEQRRAATREELMARGVELLLTCPACRRCYGHGHARCDADGHTLSTPARPLPLCFQDRYRLVRVLGEGAMGTVFEARDLRLERPVALKVLRPELFDQPAYRLRYELEARTLARIQHPGVVAVHDRGELEDGSEFLVMERLEGRTLRQTLDAFGAGTPVQVAALLRQGAAALEAAHAVGVLHRDLKPENIFVVESAEGLRFKLLDFGLAKPLEADGGLTQAGLVMGTPLYMAPEQVTAQALDARSDLYAFAAVAFEALTGRRLVRGGTLADICIEVARTPAPPPSTVRPGLSPAVDGVFLQALEKHRERRPDSPTAWAAAVAAVLEALPSGSPGWLPAADPVPDPGEPTVAFPRPFPDSPEDARPPMG